MNIEFVTALVSMFLNYPLDEINIIDWSFTNDRTLKVKMEDKDDGAVEVYEFTINPCGYAKTPAADGNFECVEI